MKNKVRIFFKTKKEKVRFFLVFTCFFASHAFLPAQNNALITIKKENISVVEALQAVEKQTNMFVAYNESQLKNQKNNQLIMVKKH